MIAGAVYDQAFGTGLGQYLNLGTIRTRYR